jgi:mono/diheme cytochrome c family protein
MLPGAAIGRRARRKSRKVLFCFWRPLATAALVTIGLGAAVAADGPEAKIHGKRLLESNCARCHSIGATGESPLKQAPPLREIYRKYPVQKLQFEFAEGMGSRHRDMPQIQFSSEQVDGILTYLSEIAGQPPPGDEPALIPPGSCGAEPP